jgi:hypothetical protein
LAVCFSQRWLLEEQESFALILFSEFLGQTPGGRLILGLLDLEDYRIKFLKTSKQFC